VADLSEAGRASEASETSETSEAAERERNRQRDVALLVGVRRNDLRALREFVQRFEPILLDQARRLDVSQDDRRTVVTGFLDDILVKLARSAAPRSLASFVVTSFRNCVADAHREASARERQSRAQEEMIGSERVIGAGCSEFMLRAARGADAEEETSESPGVALARVLFASCSVQDRQLLVWSAHRVPLRECAAWLGISYDSAKQRMSRLRARLIRESVAHLSELPAHDRANVSRLLHRAGVKTNNDTTRGSAA
jgi:DNA-directed RNA polymerase specialized sigma24 family protein